MIPVLSLVCLIVTAQQWTAMDSAMEAVSVSTILFDGFQTHQLLFERPNNRDGGYQFIETNPVLGRRPSRAKFWIYESSVVGLHIGVAAMLPKPWRTIFQSVTIGMQGVTIYYNWSL